MVEVVDGVDFVEVGEDGVEFLHGFAEFGEADVLEEFGEGLFLVFEVDKDGENAESHKDNEKQVGAIDGKDDHLEVGFLMSESLFDLSFE